MCVRVCVCMYIYIYIYAYIHIHTPYILESNPHPFYSFKGLKSHVDLNRVRIKIRGRELDFGKMIEPLYVP